MNRKVAKIKGDTYRMVKRRVGSAEVIDVQVPEFLKPAPPMKIPEMTIPLVSRSVVRENGKIVDAIISLLDGMKIGKAQAIVAIVKEHLDAQAGWSL